MVLKILQVEGRNVIALKLEIASWVEAFEGLSGMN